MRLSLPFPVFHHVSCVLRFVTASDRRRHRVAVFSQQQLWLSFVFFMKCLKHVKWIDHYVCASDFMLAYILLFSVVGFFLYIFRFGFCLFPLTFSIYRALWMQPVTHQSVTHQSLSSAQSDVLSAVVTPALVCLGIQPRGLCKMKCHISGAARLSDVCTDSG